MEMIYIVYKDICQQVYLNITAPFSFREVSIALKLVLISKIFLLLFFVFLGS